MQKYSRDTILYHKEKVFIKSSEIAEDCYRLLNYIEDCYCIIGVARSGVFPASLIALFANSPLYSYEQNNGTITNLRGGGRTNIMFNEQEKRYSKNIYIVDDSAYSGRSMRIAKSRIQRQFPDKNIISMVLYAGSNAYESGLIDYAARITDEHWFEWNMFSSPVSKGVCIDFDGILCRDFMPWEDDDGEVYLQTLKNMKLGSIRPQNRWTVDIITARLDKWREPTEEWLKKNNISYNNLFMGPWNNISERFNVNIGKWKADIYKDLSKTLFVESDLTQALEIYKHTGKDVLHYESGRVFSCSLPSKEMVI
jgi:uncharacterized HAD superfamily protein/hypoxanthine phosphoribosyltransferase